MTPLGSIATLAVAVPRTRISGFCSQKPRSCGLPRQSLRGFAPSTSSCCFPTAEGWLLGLAEDPRETHYAQKCQNPEQASSWKQFGGHVASINYRCLSRGGTMKSRAGCLAGMAKRWSHYRTRETPTASKLRESASMANAVPQPGAIAGDPGACMSTCSCVPTPTDLPHWHRGCGHCHVHSSSHKRGCNAWRGQPPGALAQVRRSGRFTRSTFSGGAAWLGQIGVDKRVGWIS